MVGVEQNTLQLYANGKVESKEAALAMMMLILRTILIMLHRQES
jgi:hypothetical protein